MKLRTTILLSLAVVGILCMASCTKSYTCECTIIYSGYPGLPDTATQDFSITNSETGAKSQCSAATGTFTNNGITTVETCALY